VQLEPDSLYEVLTMTSRYVIDTGEMLAVREPRVPTYAAPPPHRHLVHKSLFTDAGTIALAALPDVHVGEPMRMSVYVDDNLLSRAEAGHPTAMVTTPVTDIEALPDPIGGGLGLGG
jgi:hypothetical protein